jgi:hypothetical protein
MDGDRPQRRQADVSPETRQSRQPPATNVTININLPKLKLPGPPNPRHLWAKRPAWPYKKIAIRGGSLLAVILLAVVVQRGVTHYRDQAKAAKARAAVVRAGQVPGSTYPTFTPVVPKTKPELASLATGKTAYDSQHNTYSYKDTLRGTSFLVSEQPVPSTFKSTQEAVTKIAASVGAKEPILLSRGQAYIYTDNRSNAQTVVAAVKNLLVFINSPFRHDPAEWKDYLENLQ